MWNCVGQQCHICLTSYEDEGQPADPNYRKQILQTCSTCLVSELGVDWNSISADDYLPFCAQCLEKLEKMAKYNENIEEVQTEIKSFVQRFTLKAVRSRRQMKDKGVTLPASLTMSVNSRIKVEPLEQQNCVACFNYYESLQCRNEQLALEKENILENCKEHLYADFITNSGGFDWNSIPVRQALPFCPNCYLTIKKICELGNRLKTFEAESSDFFDVFIIEIFEFRDKKRKTANSRNTDLTNNPNSVTVPTGKTTIVINTRLTQKDEDDCVSASDEYSAHINDPEGPRIVDTTTLTRPEVVSSTNQSGGQSDLRRKSESLPAEKSHSTNNRNLLENVAGGSSRPIIRRKRIFEDDQLIINDVSDIILPPGTSIEELPLSTSGVNELELEENQDIEEEEAVSLPSARKPRKKRRVRFTENSKIRTRTKCGKCQRSFTYERSYNKHKDTCSELEIETCSVNGTPTSATEPEVSFAEMPHLQVEYSNYPDVQMETVRDTFSCSLCSKAFQTKENLQRHIAMHTAERPHKCVKCNATFVQLNYLKNHIRFNKCTPQIMASTSANWTSTPKNGAQSKVKGNTNARSSGKPPFSYSCNYCSFNARNSTVLSNHLQKHLDVAVESSCVICRHVCSNKYTLRVHMKRKHPPGAVNNSDILDQVMQQMMNTEQSDERTPVKRGKNTAVGLWVQSGFARD